MSRLVTGLNSERYGDMVLPSVPSVVIDERAFFDAHEGMFLLVLVALSGYAEAGELHKFTLINVIFDGTKIWLPSSLRFTASKAGLHDFVCHLHPLHIGGQILVVK